MEAYLYLPTEPKLRTLLLYFRSYSNFSKPTLPLIFTSPPNFSGLEQWTYISYRAMLEIPSKSIHDKLVIVCRDDVLSYSTETFQN